MNYPLSAVLTLAVGGIFGLVFLFLKVPNGLRVGALLGASLLGVFFRAAWMPVESRFVVQIVAGALIGCGLEKSDIRHLPKIMKPTAIVLGTFLALNLSAGALIALLSPLSLVTGLMCVVPGGVTDTPIIAADMGADTTKVALVQLARYFLGVGGFPPMVVAFDNFMGKREARKPGAPAFGGAENKPAESVPAQPVISLPGMAPVPGDDVLPAEAGTETKPDHSPLKIICTLLIGGAGGFLGGLTGIPAGTFLFTVITVLSMKLLFNFAFVPRWIKKITLWVSGCYIGSLMTMDDVRSFGQLAIPLALTLGGYIANCFITGKILRKVCGLSRKEAMLTTSPAGASDLALSAADMGIQSTDIVIIQIFRAIIAIAVFPQIINLLLYFIG